jgi:hypothetical protein
MSVAPELSDPAAPKPESLISRASSLVKDAAHHHPQMTVFLAVLAVAAVGAAIWAMFGFSTETAVFFTAFAVCIAHVILPWITPQTGQARSVWYLTVTMAWGLSIVLLITVAAYATSHIACRFGGYSCPAEPAPARHASIGDFSLLDEHKVNTDNPDAHVFAKAVKVTRNTIWYAAGGPPLIALVTTMDNFGRRADGKIDVAIETYVGTKTQDLTIMDANVYDSPKKWRTDSLVDRYPGKADALIADLRQQGILVGPETIVMLTTLTCLPKPVLESKTAMVRTLLLDRVTHTYSEAELPNLRLMEEPLMKAAACREQATTG